VQTAKRRIASSHVDKQNEVIAVEALRGLVETINSTYVPMSQEHDPRIAPVGRVVSAELVALPDGEHAVDAVMELFEGESVRYEPNGRRLAVRTYNADDATVVARYDRSFDDDESLKLLGEVGEVLGVEPQQELKKSVEPVSVLALVGAFLAGQISVGFLQAIGQDAWEKVKERYRKLVVRQQALSKDRILMADLFLARGDGTQLNVQVLVEQPSIDDVEALYETAMRRLEEVAPMYLGNSDTVARVVFEYRDGKLTELYSVRDDGVPLKLIQ